MIRAILSDVEGTTSSIAFVAEVLFPYARAHLPGFCAAHADRVAPILDEVRSLAPGADPVATLIGWIDADAKVAPLKELQGLIWADGYAQGAFRGHVYADAVAALARWQAAGVALYIFSSGSVAAQKLLFAHSEAGDLTPLFAGHFDTRTGAKRDPAAYVTITGAIGLPAGDILFLSDTPEEVAAARSAGMQALLIDRSGAGGDIASFDEIVLPAAAGVGR